MSQTHRAPRSGRQFALLVVALLPATLGAVELGRQLVYAEQLQLLVGAACYWGLFLAAFGLSRFRGRAGGLPDPVILPLIAFLSGAGLVELYRLTPELAQRQLGWLALSLAAWVLLGAWVGWGGLRRVWPLWGMLAAALSWATCLVGTTVGGARAWLTVGGWQFQPVELSKLLLIFFVAGFLQSRAAWRTAGNRLLAWLLFGVVWGATVGAVVLQHDLGGALLLVGCSLVLLVSERQSRPLLLPVLLLGILVAVTAYFRLPYVRARLDAWLFPFADPHGIGYQAVQALYALGSGGLFGAGLGQGLPSRIPVAGSDYLLAAWGEEVGFLGIVPVLLALFLLASRAVATGRRCASSPSDESAFMGLVLAGMGALWALQGFLIAGGIARVVPVTGVPFPWMSYGGSSLVMNGVAAGLLAAASRRPLPATPLRRVSSDLSPALEEQAATSGTVSDPHRMVPSERFFRWLGRAVSTGFVILVGAFSYWQVVQGDNLARSPQNPRVLMRALGVARGGIYDRHDRALADPIDPSGSTTTGRHTYQFQTRRYHVDPSFGPVIGYLDPQVGVAGLEAAWSDWLTRAGTGPAQWLDLAMGRTRTSGPGNLYLTIDATLQSLAGRLLRGKAGAAVVMDVQTGELLALASSPGFDPQTVAAHWQELLDEKDHPLFSRSVQGQYAPGSVWKPLVLAAALQSGKVETTATFMDTGSVTIDGNVIRNAGGEAFGQLDLKHALAVSSNVVFAQLGASLSPQDWQQYLEPLVEWRVVTPDRRSLPVTAGAFPAGDQLSPVARAEMGIGQGPLGLSPVALAVGIGALANKGIAVTPRLVQEGVGPSGEALPLPEPREVRLFSPEVAGFVVQAMEEVVSGGTGRLAALPGVTVAGKTGTAQTPGGREDAWFAGFAPAHDARVVVVVVIEGGGAGGRAAAPIARQLLAAALSVVGPSADRAAGSGAMAGRR
ncbi:MAG: FtsW/RodA/SpoVE family cell cycle protein [Limnochordaceae bacterium]|nr:FtsW/RodA/SpoVE family cell cycle protein [Limnochordaceae bacterium]